MTVQEWDGTNWTSASDLPTPGLNAFADENISLVEERILFDGSSGRVVPEVTTVRMLTKITYVRRDSTTALDYRLRDYERNQTGLMLTLPNGERKEGFIKNVRREYLLGRETHEYIVSHDFKLFDVDQNGYIGDELV